MKSKLKNLFDQYRYALLLFCLFLAEFAMVAPRFYITNIWIVTPYALHYGFGFSTRLMAGSILHLLLGEANVANIWYFVAGCALLLTGLFCLFYQHCLNHCPASAKPFLAAMGLLWFASPASISYLFQPELFGRLELYLLLIFLVCVILLVKNRWLWLMFPLSIVAILTHQVFLFLYAPILCAMLLHQVLRGNKKAFWVLAVSSVSMVVCFLYVVLVANSLPFENAGALLAQIPNAKELFLSEEMLRTEYFSDLSTKTVSFFAQQPQSFLCLFCLSAPILLVAFHWIILFYSKAYYLAADLRSKLAVLSICILPIVGIFPAFITAVDWGRWFAAFFISECFGIVYLMMQQEASALDAAEWLFQWFARYKIAYLLFALFTLSLGRFDPLEIFPWLIAIFPQLIVHLNPAL